MARSINPVPQFFENDGSPLINGLMYFYDSGTNTPKVTYKDANLTIPNTHPVVLSASGEMPNVIFTGSAKQKLVDANGGMRWERDPVGVIDSTFGNPYSAIITYSADEVVRGSDGVYYVSINDGNQGHNPVSTSGFWKLLYSILYSSSVTYTQGANAMGSNGILYSSLAGGNVGNDPVSSPLKWQVAATINWQEGVTYPENANALGSNGILYKSLSGSNLGNNPTSSPSSWVSAFDVVLDLPLAAMQAAALSF
jgi:hypothetical protein